MNEFLNIIKGPIEAELDSFKVLFDKTLTHNDSALGSALEHIKKQKGKQMRPMLILLIAKALGEVNDTTYHAAVALELLHTASLVHDDVVDKADERRGQQSVNSLYDNKIAVLVGDHILSTALLSVCKTGRVDIITYLSQLGQTLSDGEILQLTSNKQQLISEQEYYNIIRQKTAALFKACATMGALSIGADAQRMEQAENFGQTLGIIFQIRDDIFDYFPSSKIGKPTGNDMREGKLTLPAIYAVLHSDDEKIKSIAQKVKQLSASAEEIQQLVAYTIDNGGITYAEQKMQELHAQCLQFINSISQTDIKKALTAYLDYCINREF